MSLRDLMSLVEKKDLLRPDDLKLQRFRQNTTIVWREMRVKTIRTALVDDFLADTSKILGASSNKVGRDVKIPFRLFSKR